MATRAVVPEADRLSPLAGLRGSEAGARLPISISGCARADPGAVPFETNTSVEKEMARAASALVAEYVRVVVIAGTVGGASNRPATGR